MIELYNFQDCSMERSMYGFNLIHVYVMDVTSFCSDFSYITFRFTLYIPKPKALTLTYAYDLHLAQCDMQQNSHLYRAS